MNILIVGNGFDLSHYLPTKYDHFMVAMDAIENWNIDDGDMVFDDLFKSLYLKEEDFFSYTKAMYETEEIRIPIEKIEIIKLKLKENVWYRYFFDHVKEVNTWIDFELKIKEALKIVCEYMLNIEKYLKNKNDLDGVIRAFKDNKDGEYFLSQKDIRTLELLDLFQVEYQVNNYSESGHYEPLKSNYDDDWDISQEENTANFFQKMKGFDVYNGFVAQIYL